jgi:type VI secretion system protein ImpF
MRQSLLDRLIDNEPEQRSESVQQRKISYNQLRAVVERDLENLLNTKCFLTDMPESYQQLKRSLLVYGLSDYTSKNPGIPAVRSELRQEMERAINLFEPRLRNVTVKVGPPESGDRRLRFKISALLQVDEEKEPVSFDTYYDSNRSEYKITN